MFYFSFERESLFEDSLNVIFVAMVFLWFFIVFFMAFLWKWFSYDLYDFLDVLVVGMIFMIFCYNPLWSLWFLWFLWSWTFYSCFFRIMWILLPHWRTLKAALLLPAIVQFCSCTLFDVLGVFCVLHLSSELCAAVRQQCGFCQFSQFICNISY